MKLSVQTKKLKHLLDDALMVIDKSEIGAFYNHVLLSAGDLFKIKANGSSIGFASSCDADIIKIGEAAIPGKMLGDILRHADADKTEMIESGERELKIKIGSVSYNLPCLQENDLPESRTYNTETSLSIESKKFLNLLNDVSFCSGISEYQINLCGVYIHNIDNKLRAVTTDSQRLAYSEMGSSFMVPQNGITIPIKAVRAISKIRWGENLNLTLAPSGCTITDSKTSLSYSHLGISFPDYIQAIGPAPIKKTIHVQTVALSSALKRVALMGDSRTPIVEFRFSKDKLLLLVESPEIGNAQEMLNVEYDGDDFTIWANARYVLDVLGHMDEEAQFGFGDVQDPIHIKNVDNDGVSDTSRLYIVMPTTGKAR